MGKMAITQKQRPIFVSATRSGYVVFLEQLRGLLQEDIDLFVEKTTVIPQRSHDNAASRLADWKGSESSVYTKESLESEVEMRRRQLEDRIQAATAKSEMRATLELPRGLNVEIRGTAEEIFHHPDLHRANKIQIDASAASVGKSIRVVISAAEGLSATITSDDESWFLSTIAKFRQERMRLRPAWAWLHDTPTLVVYFIVWSGLIAFILTVVDLPVIPALFIGFLAGTVTFWPLKALAVPSYEVVDAPRSRNIAVRWLLGIVGTLTIGTVGGLITKLLFP